MFLLPEVGWGPPTSLSQSLSSHAFLKTIFPFLVGGHASVWIHAAHLWAESSPELLPRPANTAPGLLIACLKAHFCFLWPLGGNVVYNFVLTVPWFLKIVPG